MPRVSQTLSRAPSGGTVRRRATLSVVHLGLLLVLAQLVFRAWALSGSWFYFDDLAFMSRAMNRPLDASYLFESYGGHLMPGGFALVWVLTRLAVYTWWVWATVLLVMQAAAGIGMLRLLRSMFGDSRVVLALLAGYLFLVFTLSAGIWFAAGINQLPMQIALVFGLHAFLSYLRHNRWQHLAATVAWTVFGLVFYEKTLLLIGVYGLVALCWFASGKTPERLKYLWQTYRSGIVALGGLGGAYVLLYALTGLNFAPGTAGTQPLSPILWNLVFVAGSTGVIGGPLSWRPIDVGSFADPSQLLMLGSWVLLGALVYHASQTRAQSRRAWSLVGFTLLSNVVLLGAARASIVGPEIALEYRYQTETAALFVLSAGLAFLPLIGAPVQNAVQHDVASTYETRRVVGLGVVAVVLASLVSSVKYVDLWDGQNPTKTYYTNVTRSLDQARHPVTLVDQGVPQELLWAYRYPENTYSHVFRNLSRQTSYPTESIRRPSLFDRAGHLSPAVVPPTRQMKPHPGCGYALQETSRNIPLDGPVTGGGWWIQLSYSSETATALHVKVGQETHQLMLPAGPHSAFFTASGDFSRLTLDGYAAKAKVCVNSLRLGLPETGSSSQ